MMSLDAYVTVAGFLFMINWSHYLVPDAAHRRLGLACLGVGAQEAQGPGVLERSLDCYAAVLVTSGTGSLATGGGLPLAVRPPALFWLFPGVRHTYRPDGRWSERWVLFDGPAGGAYEELGWLSRSAPVVPLAEPGAVDGVLARLARAAREVEGQVTTSALLHELVVTVRRAARARTDDTVLRALATDALLRLPVAEHARRLGLSERALRQRVRAAVGLTPADYLLSVRLRTAKELLAGTDLPVAAIARRVGYDDTAYFTRIFTRRTGTQPTAFRAARWQAADPVGRADHRATGHADPVDLPGADPTGL
jgi:AraC-like DNA-binding protein